MKIDDRWQRVEALYHAALQRLPSERATFLRDACAGDDALRRDVESLLAQPASDVGFLQTPALAVAARDVATGSGDARLAVGHVLGPYTILGRLGTGGMGEVYRARDSQLGREVAIKVLLPKFVNNPERLARFEREARVLASLNHSHIGAIYALEPIAQGRALVLELVEGLTLAERLARGPLPGAEALRIATQVADALEAAHEKGIVHRDLKPANIKVAPVGVVKVLDFGLAKAITGDGSSPDLTKSSAVSLDGSVMRVIGTPAYMSPEQACGQAVDKRTDIWAFGCVLYEMLTGRPVFAGATVSDTLAAILEREPDWTSLPVAIPPAIRRLLRRCLEKDPKRRLRDIGDARIEIEAAPDERDAGPQQVPSSRSLITGWNPIAIVFLLLAGLGALWFSRRGPAEARVIQSSIIPPANLTNLPMQRLAISPDGRRLVFTAPSASGSTILWVRALGDAVAQPLAGTDGATTPFWSPDARTVGFFSADGKLKRIEASGGPVSTLADALPFGGTWNRDGVILFVQTAGTLSRLSTASGAVRPVVTVGANGGIGTPWFLPDGRHFLYNHPTSDGDRRGTYVGSLESSERTRILDWPTNAQYAEGYVLFTRGQTLMAQVFDLEHLTMKGAAETLAEGIQTYAPAAEMGAFSVSQNGLLVFQNAARSDDSRLVWYNRSGQQVGVVADRINSTWGSEIALSPDGGSTAVVISAEDRSANDLWVFDMRQGLRTRLTFGPETEHMPVWSPNGQTVVYGRRKNRGFDLFRKAANGGGPEDLLLSDGRTNFPESWSPDGGFLIYDVARPAASGRDLWVLPLQGDRKPFPLIQTPFSVMQSQFSPDGRWIAYAGSSESGRFEVYVTAFADARGRAGGEHPSPKPAAKWQVSTMGGVHPRWRRDGKELFYLAGDTVMAASVAAEGDHVTVGRVERLFDARPIRPSTATNLPFTVYDVSPDGQRFLINTVDESAPVAPLTLIQHWPALLRR